MRMKFYLSIVWACVCLLCACQKETKRALEIGVSQELAESRKMRLKELEYQLYFDIPKEQEKQAKGRVIVQFWSENTEELLLDFRAKPEQLLKVMVNGKTEQPRLEQEHIILSTAHLIAGKNEVEIEFISDNRAMNRNVDYLYTLLVPDRARTLFPCFDQPDLKACYQLNLNIPEDWVAVGNAPMKSQEIVDGQKVVTFEKTQPLSSYLFSFVAGRWECCTDNREGRIVSLYHRETDPKKLDQLNIIFDQVYSSLNWLEEYTGIPYPFKKYDLVIVPGFQFGGMEHAGAILYNDKRMFLSEHPTTAEELGRMELIAHETAHMWFGDYVTMAWFDDVWTKEIFANYFAARMIEPRFPQVNHRLNALRSFYPSAYSEDRTAGTNSIRQKLGNLNDAGLVYGQIIYNKAPVVMQKLVELMGEEPFRQGIQDYLRTYAYDNATWDGLIQILDTYTSEDLTAWSKVWVDEKGRPEVSCEQHGNSLCFKQRDAWGRDIQWQQRLSFTLLRKGEQPKTVELMMKDSIAVFPIEQPLDWIIPNSDGTGYGYFKMDSASIAYALEHLSDFSDPVTRLSLIISLNENYLDKQIEPDVFAKALLRLLSTEQEILIYTTALGYLKNAYYSCQTERTYVEQQLFGLVQQRKLMEYRQSAFRVLLEVWTESDVTDWMFQMWQKVKSDVNLSLSERDKMKMAYELAIRLPNRFNELKKEQLQRIANQDRKREFAFIMEAVNPQEEVRDSIFRSFLVAENRTIEPWVEQALYYLNHPLRGKESLKYIRPVLEQLQEVQRTGDIFFPKDWVSACLRGHRGEEAARIVEQFLQERPDYPVLLKNKILQSADHLRK